MNRAHLNSNKNPFMELTSWNLKCSIFNFKSSFSVWLNKEMCANRNYSIIFILIGSFVVIWCWTSFSLKDELPILCLVIHPEMYSLHSVFSVVCTYIVFILFSYSHSQNYASSIWLVVASSNYSWFFFLFLFYWMTLARQLRYYLNVFSSFVIIFRNRSYYSLSFTEWNLLHFFLGRRICLNLSRLNTNEKKKHRTKTKK